MDLLGIFGLILFVVIALGWGIIVILYGDEWIKWLIKIKLLNQDFSTKSNVIKIFMIHIVFVPIGILLPITGLIISLLLFGIEIGLLLYRLDNARFIVRLFFVIEEFIFKKCICLYGIFCVCLSPFVMVIDTTQSLVISFLCWSLLLCFIGLFIYYLSWYLCIGFGKTLEKEKNLDYKITKIASYIFVVGYVCCWIFMAIYSSFYEATENGFILCILGIFLFLFVPILLRSFIKKLCFEILQTQDSQKSLD